MKTILTIDDDPVVRTLVKKIFEQVGFKVITAADGFEGIHSILTKKPDLIFLDIMMPIIDGIEVLKRVKKMPEVAAIPIIMFTAVADSQKVVQSSQLGAADYVIKPFQSSILIKKVQEVLLKTQTDASV
ncbi:MAG: response regulator [Candidatus Marinimicrobia bacterium]|nr:response regulator [Candidatus Neomarinimicrobiota bacterium]